MPFAFAILVGLQLVGEVLRQTLHLMAFDIRSDVLR
jgi:hypothetical protein